MKSFQSASTSPLPFFVYGTLRQGEPNHFYFEKVLVSVAAAVLPAAQLWNMGAYPMAIAGEGEIYGELIKVDPRRYDILLTQLDRLEGVNLLDPEKPGGLYHRTRKQVFVSGTPIEAWVYFGREDLARRGKIISHGDWKKRKIAPGSP